MVLQLKEFNQPHNYGNPIPEIDNGQWNLLIIAVDRLTPYHPSLIGLWLLITSSESQSLTLVPIFPAGNQNFSVENIKWEKIFSINSEKKPNMNFLERISEQILWDDYLIIDLEGMSHVIENFTDDSYIYQGSESLGKGVMLPGTGKVIDLSLDGQEKIWRSVCQELSSIAEPSHLINRLDLIKPHLHSKINLDEIAIQRSFQNKNQLKLTCNFPTLSLNSP